MKIERFKDIEAWQVARELTRKGNERLVYARPTGRKVTLNGAPGNP
jgi:hypothetical protein